MLRLLISVLLWWPALAAADMLKPASLEDQSPREALRKAVFGESKAHECKILSKEPAGKIPQDESLSGAITALMSAIKGGDDKAMVPLFHPLLKVRSAQVKAALISIDRISGGKSEVSLFRAYALNNVTGDVVLTECPEDGLKLYPLYGHPLQVGVWIQVSGKDEVARVYAVMIPGKSDWKIASWHVQQWTHAGKDIDTWRADAAALRAKKDDLAAFIYLDLAAKLLDGGKFIEFPVAKDVVSERDSISGGKSLIDLLAPKFPGEDLAYASSLFSRKGAAALVRFRVPAEMSANAIKAHCVDRFQKLRTESWMRALAGMRCDYVLPRESALKEGAMGGIFVDDETTPPKR